MRLPSLPAGADPGARQYHAQICECLRELETLVITRTPEQKPAAEQLSGNLALTQTLAYTLAADVTLQQSELNLWHVVNCTSDCAMTFPTPVEGGFIYVANVGTAVLTLKNDSAVAYAPALRQGGWIYAPSINDSSGVPKWPTGLTVIGSNGTITTSMDFTFDTSTMGPVYKSPNGHYWLITISDAGAVTSADLGTILPVTS